MIDLPSSWTRVAASIVGALAIASCTFLGSRELTQCESDGDCFGSKVVGANRPGVCVEHLCAEPPKTEAGADAPADAAPDAQTDAPISCKQTTPDCPNDNLCVDGTCRRLVDPTGLCPRFPSSPFPLTYKEEGVLIVGAYVFAPLSNGPEVKAIDRAVLEINQTLPGESRIAVVLCEKKGKLVNRSAQDTIDHLSQLKVPLVIGAFEASELVDLKTKGVAVWSTLGNDRSLQQVGDAGGPTDGGAVPFRFLVDELQNLVPGFEDAVNEAAARADILDGSALGSSVKVRLALSEQLETLPLELKLQASVSLMASDRPVGTYARNLAPLKASFETGSASDGLTAKELIAAGPQIIVAIGGDEIATLVSNVEGSWGATKRPVWVLGARGKFSAAALYAQANQSTRKLRERIIGVDFAGSKSNLDIFRTALASTAHAGSFDNIYDALYAAAYAGGRAEFHRGASKTAYTAFDLNRGLDEVLQPAGPGSLTVSSAAGFPTSVASVKAGKTIAFTGTTGPWLFPTTDATHGVRRMGTSYYCFKPAGELAYYVDAPSLADKTLCARP